jgi:hypothetical protein
MTTTTATTKLHTFNICLWLVYISSTGSLWRSLPARACDISKMLSIPPPTNRLSVLVFYPRLIFYPHRRSTCFSITPPLKNEVIILYARNIRCSLQTVHPFKLRTQMRCLSGKTLPVRL